MNLLEMIAPGFAARRAQSRFEQAQYEAGLRMLESIPSFAKDDDEGDWSLVDAGTYSESEIDTNRDQARTLYYKDPCARGIIETMVNFIIGKNCKIEALDESPEVQEYWDGWVKANDWDNRSKEFTRRLLRDGEVFLRKFKPKPGGKHRLYRFIPPGEIQNPNGHNGWGDHSYGIECDPDDIETPVNYFRRYTKNNVQNWEIIPADEVLHVKILVDSDFKRGISFFVGIGKYLAKYNGWIDDRIQLNKIRHLFNLVVRPTGGSSTAALKSQFNDVTGKTPTGGTANKKLPKPGSVLLAKGVEYEYANLNINASDTKDDGRAIELMICKGTCLAEYVIRGDASNANYASTMVSESPMVRAFEYWQDFIEKPFQQIFEQEIKYGMSIGEIPESSVQTITEPDEAGLPVTRTETIPTRTDCQVNFATLIHRDLKSETDALAIHDNQRYASKETIAGKLGYDYLEEKAKIEQQDREDEARMKRMDLNFEHEHEGEDDNGEEDGEEGTAKEAAEGRWITTETGHKVFIAKGQSVAAAIKAEFGGGGSISKDGNKGSGSSNKNTVTYSKDELSSVRNYQNAASNSPESYDQVNSYLRRNEKNRKDIDSAVSAMDKIIEKAAPLTPGTILYRGANLPNLSKTKPNEIVGKYIKDKAFLSCSTDEDIAKSFSMDRKTDRVLFIIKTNEKTKGIVPADITKTMSAEKEVLLKRNTSFKITSAKKSGGIYKIEMEAA